MRTAPTRGSLRLAQASAVATALAVIGLQPIVDSGFWMVPAGVSILLVMGIGIGLRALRVPAWAVLLTQGVAVVLWTGSQVAGEQARLAFLPSRAWAQRIAETYQLGIDTVAEYSAPVPLDDGVLLLVVGGVGLVAWSVDALAVTARLVPLAGIPLAVVHAVAMATTPGGPTIWAFVAAAAGYLLLLAVDGRERSRRWGRPLGSPATSVAAGGTLATSLSPIGTPIALVAVVVAVAGAAVVPQGGLAIFDGTGGSGDGGGLTIRTDNPIVDLRRDLVQPDDVEVIRFTTTAAVPEYLRLLTLDVYDGSVWRTADRPVPEENRITGEMPNPPGLGPDVPRTEEQYAFETTDRLQSEWLPLPYPVSEVTTAEGDWRYHSETLDVVATDRDTRNLRYDVTAVVVEPTPEQLSGIPPLPGRFIDLLDLPEDLPPLVRELANEVTEGAGDGYQRAVALQQWFREGGGFVYDLSIDPGNGTDDLVAFLEQRRGYCEQFAASMAIMARVLGIPARVAVGYLRGDQTQPGFWVVSAQDAHAWPELYFDGIGWVRFEPTPGIRTGSAPDYTRPDATTEVPESLENPVATSAPDSDPNAAAPLDSPVQEGALTGNEPSRLPLLAAAVALVLVAVAPLLVGVLVRGRRWGRVGRDPRLAAEAAWADVQDTALEVGHPTDPAQTVRVAAAGLGDTAGLSDAGRERLVAVALATERARFAQRPADGDTLRQDAAQVRHEFLSLANRRTRWSARLWPAPVRRTARRLLGRR